ncbi:hypothetical protein [Nocardia sp. NPDC049149]|uniref:hypothetical protein n=1 Tax=Nocardia sp. NPDC049149 TaxID=3364315 RepID=UPI003718B73B
MVVQLSWTGLEVRALRNALRETRPGFCEITGVHFEALRKWERRGATVTLRASNAAIMDTTLARATDDQRDRFRLRCAELRQPDDHAEEASSTPKLDIDDPDRPSAPCGPYAMEINDMNRRELLRLLSISSAALASPPLDWDRILAAADGFSRIDAATANEYASINHTLWASYSRAVTKAETFPAVREHLDAVLDGLLRARDDSVRRSMCALTGEVLQLAGEILLDNADYGTASHCYTLAAAFSKDAGAMDLWACAMTRHAYINLFDRQFSAAIPLLESASQLAHRGDPSMTTRYWVDAVLAQALAGLGDADGCRRASDSARAALDMTGAPHIGWLRFDGSRLDEELGACYVQLGRPEQAEPILLSVLDRPLSTRRRAGVLIDLAAAGAMRQDPIQLVTYGNAALDAARRTHSGYLGRRLELLRRHLEPIQDDRHVRHLSKQIAGLQLR